LTSIDQPWEKYVLCITDAGNVTHFYKQVKARFIMKCGSEVSYQAETDSYNISLFDLTSLLDEFVQPFPFFLWSYKMHGQQTRLQFGKLLHLCHDAQRTQQKKVSYLYVILLLLNCGLLHQTS